jgi:hypothetical protein
VFVTFETARKLPAAASSSIHYCCWLLASTGFSWAVAMGQGSMQALHAS